MGCFQYFSALIYECLQCISVVKPDAKVIGEAVTHVGRFMRSADPNLRYVGTVGFCFFKEVREVDFFMITLKIEACKTAQR